MKSLKIPFKYPSTFIGSILMIVSFQGYTQTGENVLHSTALSKAPHASIKDVLWMQGDWRCEKWKGHCREDWKDSLGHAMVGVFQYYSGGRIGFYELITLTEMNHSLVMKIKHFHSDLKGWEHRDSTVTFNLLKIEPMVAHFDGITYKRIDEKHLDVFVFIKHKEGQKEEAFHFEKR